ncbi:MAG: gamma-glutamylcyclotransferase [Verrucomicrobia bacterium]|nr:gamma-glutamylcyclotransferase [Verrucomicrobiota bacterium]
MGAADQPLDGCWLACYGTLRRRSLYARTNHTATGRLQFWGYGLVCGRLRWQRAYPALVSEPGLVRVEIYRINDPAAFTWLDAYEGYIPGRPARSLFLRRLTPLHHPRLRVWVYHLNTALKLFGPPGDVPPMAEVREARRWISFG